MGHLPEVIAYDLSAVDIPDARQPWKIEWQDSMLLVHDVQNFFLQPFPEPMKTSLIDQIEMVCASAHVAGSPIVYSAQPGGMSTKERGILTGLWGAGMKRSDDDTQLARNLHKAYPGEVVSKWRYSAFVGNNLDLLVRYSGIKQILICGVYAQLGILSTALDAYNRGIQVNIISSAIADFTIERHQNAVSLLADSCANVYGGVP